MKKLPTIIGVLYLTATYFTAHYASTTVFMGMSVWAVIMTVLLFFTGITLIIGDNSNV